MLIRLLSSSFDISRHHGVLEQRQAVSWNGEMISHKLINCAWNVGADWSHNWNAGISNLREVVSCIFYTFHLCFPFFAVRMLALCLHLLASCDLWFYQYSIHLSLPEASGDELVPNFFRTVASQTWTWFLWVERNKVWANLVGCCFWSHQPTNFVVMVVFSYLADIVNLSRPIHLISLDKPLSSDEATKVAEPQVGTCTVSFISFWQDLMVLVSCD